MGDIKSQKACWEEKARKLQACCCTFMRGREELFLLSTLHHPFHQLLCFIYTTWWALLLHCRDIIAWAVVCGRSPVWFQSWKTSFGSRHLCYVSEQCQVAKSLRMKAGKMIVMELNNLCWSRCAVLPITESDHSARSGALTLHVFLQCKVRGDAWVREGLWLGVRCCWSIWHAARTWYVVVSSLFIYSASLVSDVASKTQVGFEPKTWIWMVCDHKAPLWPLPLHLWLTFSLHSFTQPVFYMQFKTHSACMGGSWWSVTPWFQRKMMNGWVALVSWTV